ncbi:unnamed protein product [Timema podura]|uniref:Uncharacterized protein n=1 Tax=Timema podura TaxID=61482 RepID=A0ABN7NCE0_TIMPD|nr:unnamed protein product [Timema podura]
MCSWSNRDGVGSLQRQTEVLRTLLDSERQRVNKALASADQSALAVQEVCRERDVIKAEKESYSHQLEELEHQLQEMHIQCLNCKNENQVIRAELSTLEAQLTKERSKLYRLREDKKILLDKLLDNVYLGYMMDKVFLGYLMDKVWLGYMLDKVFLGYLMDKVWLGYMLDKMWLDTRTREGAVAVQSGSPRQSTWHLLHNMLPLIAYRPGCVRTGSGPYLFKQNKKTRIVVRRTERFQTYLFVANIDNMLLTVLLVLFETLEIDLIAGDGKVGARIPVGCTEAGFPALSSNAGRRRMNHTSIRPYYRLPSEVTHAQSESDCPPQASIREAASSDSYSWSPSVLQSLLTSGDEEDVFLVLQVQTTDESLIIKSESLSHVQTSCRELQTKLLTQTQQTSLTKTQLAEANSTVAMMKKQECQLRGEIAEMKRTLGELLVSVEELESKLASKVLANQELEVKIHEQNRELKELRERLSEALQCQESWQFRAVRVVSLCLHYPYYLLQGLVYLYNTAN